ncbi:MAG: toprim domain-containing protein, partial [Gammaproteobacteria bacterium]|nr:toprim domain-containing protein [Gammaproteobacteria bacterium]
YLGHCPFHDDKSPSLVISPDKNLWHCLGACSEGGDVIQWVMKREGLAFRDAVAWLSSDLAEFDKQSLSQSKALHDYEAENKADSDANPKTKTKKSKSLKSADTSQSITPLAANPDDQALLRQILDYYHETLKRTPKALEYLESRGLMHPELITHFKLGFADYSLSQLLPQSKVKAGAAVRDQLKQIGILRTTGQAHFTGCLLFPVLSPDGVIGEIYGRRIVDHNPSRPRHLYLPHAHQGVFNESALAVSTVDEVILCESLIDALTFWVAGYRNVTASYGTSGFTEDHLMAFKKYSIKRVLIAYDRDEAGNKAAEKLAEKLIAEGIECFRVLFPKNMDANQYALDVQPAEKSLGVVLRSAQWMGQGQNPESKPEQISKAETAAKIEKEKKTEDDIKTEVKSKTESEPKPDIKPEPETALKSIPLLAAGSSYGSEKVYQQVELFEGAELPEPTEASPQPAVPEALEAEVSEHEVKITLGDRQYRIRGLGKNKDYEQLKINLRVTRGETFHVDTLDLYLAKQRATYIKHAGMELSLEVNLLKRDLGKVLLKLEALQDEQIKAKEKPDQKKVITLSEAEHTAALELLKSPQLMQRIVADIERCGVVGEAVNSQVCYLACLSRKLDQPLAIIIQSTSAAGKSALMDAVLALMSEEEAIQYSAMTGQSLFYLGESDLKHKILAIAEEEGVKEASYALKLLQSQGELTIASTGKDADTGQLVTQEYHVEGPVMLFLTTTAIDLDEELKNRCLVLSINETREQTQTIQQRQRFEETLDGMLASEDKTEILTLHRNAQRLLRPLRVVNPFAEQLTFIDDRTRTRRDHKKYLGLIKAITLLHQYQREIKTVQHNGQKVEYIEVTQ